MDIALDRMDPPFAWTFDRTPVEIWATAPIPSGRSGFQETPQATLISESGDTVVLQETNVKLRGKE